MCFSVLLLAAAESTLPDPKSAESTGWMFITLSTIVVGVYYVLLVWRMLFPTKTPPDNEVYAAIYATKVELGKVELAHKEEMKRIENRFEKWMEQEDRQHKESMDKMEEAIGKFGDWQLSMERALGHAETKADLSLNKAHPRK